MSYRRRNNKRDPLKEFLNTPKEISVQNHPDLCIYVRDHHSKDWSDKSYLKVLRINQKNVDEIINDYDKYNLFDNDIYVSLNGIIPSNEYNYGCMSIDLSIRLPYEGVIEAFKTFFWAFYNNEMVKYNPHFITIVIKDDVVCIRIVCENYNERNEFITISGIRYECSYVNSSRNENIREIVHQITNEQHCRTIKNKTRRQKIF